MSRYNWNWRQGNMFGSSNPAPPRATDLTQIACKLCDRVFMSTQALIAHIESHLADDDLSTTVRLRQLNLPNSTDPFISSNALLRPSTNPFHQRRLFHGANNQICFVPSPAPPPPPQTHYHFPHPQQPQIPHYLLPRNPNVNSGAAGSHHMMMPYGNQMAHVVREENHSDSTRPFLSQLERPIPSINFGLDASGNPNFDNLDLALKL
ncbi:hypothetical protein D8674_010118 [Pyrus ussuriensis x Pyrus communis]|uniref:C2H2-type domain-containing protein n=1 Tax=Pyrus ussuriensis x Pyrus communis TaxID=2448454 RepID=A0A5N5FA56_9ROSA|nr:hypothetical protein D8674_010118 [Pyrus ussuriensis x Pyrus communis]